MLSVPATFHHSPATSNLFENPDKWYSTSQLLRVTLSILSGFPDSLPVPIYTPGIERGTLRVKCLAQEHNTMTQLELEPRPLNPASTP